MTIIIILSVMAGLIIGFFIGRVVENSEWKLFLKRSYRDIADGIIGQKEYWCD
jgi:hypothetical protein